MHDYCGGALAARAWIVGLLGLFVAWIAITIVTGMIGTMWGIYEFLNQSGLIDPGWDRQAHNIKDVFLGVWSYMPFIVFFSFIIYIIIESMRRRPEDYYV